MGVLGGWRFLVSEVPPAKSSIMSARSYSVTRVRPVDRVKFGVEVRGQRVEGSGWRLEGRG